MVFDPSKSEGAQRFAQRAAEQSGEGVTVDPKEDKIEVSFTALMRRMTHRAVGYEAECEGGRVAVSKIVRLKVAK